MPTELQINLRLGLEAACYAKTAVPRSANQDYKSSQRHGHKVRNIFMLGLTRCGSYVKREEGELTTFDLDPEVQKNRHEVRRILREVKSKSKQDRMILELILKLGPSYFYGKKDKKNDDKKDDFKNTASIINETGWDSMSQEQKTFMAKYLKMTVEELTMSVEQGNGKAMNSLFQFENKVHQACKYGVGNCEERARVAAFYLRDKTPGGKRLSVYHLKSRHEGDEEADHVFTVFGHIADATTTAGLGKDAIIIDAWLNDAYPVRHYNESKYQSDYRNRKSTHDQISMRTLICDTFSASIEPTLAMGEPSLLEKPTLKTPSGVKKIF